MRTGRGVRGTGLVRRGGAGPGLGATLQVSKPLCCPALPVDGQLGKELRLFTGGKKQGSLLPTKHIQGLILAWHPARTVSWPPNPLIVPVCTLLPSFSRGGNQGQRVMCTAPLASGNPDLESGLPVPLVLVSVEGTDEPRPVPALGTSQGLWNLWLHFQTPWLLDCLRS